VSLFAATSYVTGFQSFSVYVYSGLRPLSLSMMEAKEEVMTTRLTWGLCFWMEVRTEVVPLIAGFRRSRSLFSTDVTNRLAV
jgi:hypothetical protein